MAKNYEVTINKMQTLRMYKTINNIKCIVGSIANVANDNGIKVAFTDFEGFGYDLNTIDNTEIMFVQFFFDDYEICPIQEAGEDNKQPD